MTMRALDKLKESLQGQLRAVSIMEPSNATARRHIRVKPGNIKLTPIYTMNNHIGYLPYECKMDIIISYRLSGGNANESMTNTSMTESLLITEMLTKGVITIDDVGEEITDREKLKAIHPDWSMKIVGEAVLYNASRVGDGFANDSQMSDQNEILDELFFYEDQWKATLVLTLHRYFPNPLLKTIIMTNDTSKEDMEIE